MRGTGASSLGRSRARNGPGRFLAVAVVLLAACGPDGLGPGTEDETARVILELAVDESLPTEGAPSIDLILVAAHLAQDSSLAFQSLLTTDPSREEWTVSLSLLATEAEDAQGEIFMSVSLLGEDETHWSGFSAPFTVVPGAREVLGLDLFRGPLGNANVEAITLDPIPAVEVDAVVEVRATLTVPNPTTYVRYFVTSLDPEVATVEDDRDLTALAPGTARIVAVAGRAADTVVVEVAGDPPGP